MNQLEILRCLGAAEEDMDSLLKYVKNAFTFPQKDSAHDRLSENWPMYKEKIQSSCRVPPHFEMYESAAGVVPIIYPQSVDDFEAILRETVYKNKVITGLENMGASFVSNKAGDLRFIVLSDKPYSGIPASEMGLSNEKWAEKSMVIRKHHECAHLHTKRFFGLSRNHLHDELIADFCGFYAAFGEFKARWFVMSFCSRLYVYTRQLSEPAKGIVVKIAENAAQYAENWSKTGSFEKLNETELIESLAKKDLLEIMSLPQ